MSEDPLFAVKVEWDYANNCMRVGSILPADDPTVALKNECLLVRAKDELAVYQYITHLSEKPWFFPDKRAYVNLSDS